MIEFQKCLGCGHRWPPRTESRPRCCPRCHSTNWDKSKPARNVFDFGKIEVGQEAFYEWKEGQSHVVSQALNQYQSRTKRKFLRTPTAYGLKVLRLI